MLTYEELKKDESVRLYIKNADANLAAMGYTEHSFAHVCSVAETAGYILETLGYDERTVEVAKIAGSYLIIGRIYP